MAARRLERQAVERDHGSETLGEAVDFEGHRSGQDRRVRGDAPSGTTRNARPMSEPGA